MTFSKVVISTSVKIWSISGISRAPLEAKEKKDQLLGQRNRELAERGIMVSQRPHKEERQGVLT